MKELSANKRRGFASLAGAALILTVQMAAQAQGGTTPISRPGGIPGPENTRPSIKERQLVMDQMERDAAKVRTPEQEKLALVQIAEDYQRIQIINNKMMGSTIPAATPNYSFITDTTAEIRKRAIRMRDNLRLPKPKFGDGEKPPEYQKPRDVKTLKSSLLVLDDVIMRFVENPVFKNTGVVNVELAAKASRDLETIIEFSQFISKDAEKLGKAAEKPSQ